MLGSDGCVYSTQTPNVGTWAAPVQRPPSIQKTSPNGKVEILVTEADGVKFDGPNDLAFGPDGRLGRLGARREAAFRPDRRR
jgi:gluconolactonase